MSSDLSNLLGDVYGSVTPDQAPVRREPAAAERSRIESVFNAWEPAPETPAKDDGLTAALSAALSPPAQQPAQQPVAPVAPVAAPKPAFAAPQQMHAPVAAAPTTWSIGDDDILPMGRVTKKSKK